MAVITINSDTYFDDAARTAADTYTIISGAKLTFRTDTRWHAGSPASMVGSIASITCTEGEVFFDGTKVRWMPFTSDTTGVVPAIGTSLTQAGVTSSYLLGIYASITSAPTAVGAALPAAGFIKFREVTGAFVAGAITNLTNASATSTDVPGWIEIVCDDAANHVFGRLGKHKIRGDWFYLDNTTGAAGQVINTPINNGGAGTKVPAVWIEKDAARIGTYELSGSTATVSLSSHGYFVDDVVDIDFTTGDAAALPETSYLVVAILSVDSFTITLTSAGTGGNCSVTSFECWPALNGATCGWSYKHIGRPPSEKDARTNFVSDLGSGQFKIGETIDIAATYANVAKYDSADYDSLVWACTYEWANDVVIVTYASGHALLTGMNVYLDFTSGGATAYDNTYTITVLDAFTFTVPLAGSGTGGALNAKVGYRIAYTAHPFGNGDRIYCDATTGSMTDGEYIVWGQSTVDVLYIQTAHATTDSNKAVSVYGRYRISSIGHGLAIGNRVYLNFTSGSGVDGIYTIIAVAADTFDINLHNNASADSGDVTIQLVVGNVPDADRRIRIPNVILRGCATASRASNFVNATIGSRPEWAVTTAGSIDFEYTYSTWYHNFAQSYATRLHHVAYMDSMQLTECATALDLNDVYAGMNGNLDARALQLTSNFAGGTIKNGKFQRGGAVGTTDHSLEILTCKGLIFTNVQGGIIQFARSTGKGMTLSTCTDIVLNRCRSINSDLPIASCLDITINDFDHCDRYMGCTNITTPYYTFLVTGKSNNIIIDGVTLGFGGTVANVHPSSGLLSVTTCDNVALRNAGTSANPLSGGTFQPNKYGMSYVYYTGGNNDNLKVQRCYVDLVRTGLNNTINSDNNVLLESVRGGQFIESTKATFLFLNSALNTMAKGIRTGGNSVANNASVYENSFSDMFLSDIRGRMILAFNEPIDGHYGTFTLSSGTKRFNSAGGYLMSTVGEAIWEDVVFRKGHTAFNSTIAPVVTSPAAATISATARAGGNVTFTTSAHNLVIGDTVVVSGVSPNGYNGVHVVTAVPLTTTFTVVLADPGAWVSGGTVLPLDNVHFYYDLDQGSGFSTVYKNLKFTVPGCGLTSGSGTISVPTSAGINVGDYVTGKIAGMGFNAKVSTIDSDTQITVDVNSTATVTYNVLYFNALPNETIINPDMGFKIKIKAVGWANHNNNSFNFLRIDTISTAAAQTAALYPLNSATYSVQVLDIITGLPLENARVYITAYVGGSKPYQSAITITRSSTTATVTHSSHDLATGDLVLIQGADQLEYNGIKTITVIDSGSYSYTVSGSPDSPATGTITATMVIMNSLTNSSGIASGNISLTSDQPITGRVRLSIGSCMYKTSPLISTIDSSDGMSLIVQMIPDA